MKMFVQAQYFDQFLLMFLQIMLLRFISGKLQPFKVGLSDFIRSQSGLRSRTLLPIDANFLLLNPPTFSAHLNCFPYRLHILRTLLIFLGRKNALRLEKTIVLPWLYNCYCIPYLHSNLRISIYLDHFGGKLDSDCHIVTIAELTLEISHDQRWFSNP